MENSVLLFVLAANSVLLLLVYVVVPRIRSYIAQRDQRRIDLIHSLLESTRALTESQTALTATMSGLLEAYAKGDRYAQGMMVAFQSVGESAVKLEGTVSRFVSAVVRDAEPGGDEIQVLSEGDRDSLYIQQTNAEVRLRTDGLEESGAWDQKKTPGFE